MPKGRKKTHKGGHRHFTSEDDLAREQEKARKEREWREKKGLESDEEEEGDGEKKVSSTAAASTAGLGSSSSDEADDEDDKDSKPKGVAHLIDIENPNHVVRKTKKVAELDSSQSQASLTRRQREELERQQAKEHYEKMHLAGKTDEARADLARLALVRKQREEAAKKREEERKAQEDAKAAAEKRLLEKKAKSAGATSAKS